MVVFALLWTSLLPRISELRVIPLIECGANATDAVPEFKKAVSGMMKSLRDKSNLLLTELRSMQINELRESVILRVEKNSFLFAFWLVIITCAILAIAGVYLAYTRSDKGEYILLCREDSCAYNLDDEAEVAVTEKIPKEF